MLGEQNESLRTAWSDGETPEAGSPPFVFGKAGRGIAFQGQTSYGEVQVQANQLLNEPQSEANELVDRDQEEEVPEELEGEEGAEGAGDVQEVLEPEKEELPEEESPDLTASSAPEHFTLATPPPATEAILAQTKVTPHGAGKLLGLPDGLARRADKLIGPQDQRPLRERDAASSQITCEPPAFRDQSAFFDLNVNAVATMTFEEVKTTSASSSSGATAASTLHKGRQRKTSPNRGRDPMQSLEGDPWSGCPPPSGAPRLGMPTPLDAGIGMTAGPPKPKAAAKAAAAPKAAPAPQPASAPPRAPQGGRAQDTHPAPAVQGPPPPPLSADMQNLMAALKADQRSRDIDAQAFMAAQKELIYDLMDRQKKQDEIIERQRVAMERLEELRAQHAQEAGSQDNSVAKTPPNEHLQSGQRQDLPARQDHQGRQGRWAGKKSRRGEDSEGSEEEAEAPSVDFTP